MSPAPAWWPTPPGVRVRATGPDAEGFLQRMVTQDLRGLAPGRGRPACLTDRMGKLLAAFDVFRLPEGDFLLLGPEASRTGILGKLPVYLLGTKARLVEDPWPPSIGVSGIDVAALSARLGVGDAGPGGPGLRTFSGEVAGITVRVVDRGGEGFPGLEVLAEGTVDWTKVLGGAPLSPEGVVAARVEAGIPVFGIDADGSVMPTECGLGSAVAYNKGCYMGQEILERMRARKVVTRLLRRLVLEASEVPASQAEGGLPGLPVEREGKRLGVATSAVLSPDRGRVVALSSLPAREVEPGGIVQVAGVPARVEPIEKGGAP